MSMNTTPIIKTPLDSAWREYWKSHGYYPRSTYHQVILDLGEDRFMDVDFRTGEITVRWRTDEDVLIGSFDRLWTNDQLRIKLQELLLNELVVGVLDSNLRIRLRAQQTIDRNGYSLEIAPNGGSGSGSFRISTKDSIIREVEK